MPEHGITLSARLALYTPGPELLDIA